MPPSPPASRMSPTSPTAMRHRKPAVPPGFRAPPRPKQRPIVEMTVRELRDLHDRNAKILSSPAASTSTYVQRISSEQAEIEARLLELDGMESIQSSLKKTRINADEAMSVDEASEPPMSRTLEAKRRILSRFEPVSPNGQLGSLSFQEAIDLEKRAHAQDLERQQLLLEKKKRSGMPIKDEILSNAERQARIWAFMNYKPEDEDEDEDDEDPSTWFDDDQDDGRKGQNIVEPDVEDLTDIIRIDHNKLHYSTFYEPRDECT